MTETTEITVTIPALSRFVALVRVTAASLASELDFTVDEIADVRVGADELTSLLIEWAEDHSRPSISLRFQLADACLELEGTVSPADSPSGSEGVGAEPVGDGIPGLDEITEQILAAVVDSHHIRAGSGRIVKRRSAS